MKFFKQDHRHTGHGLFPYAVGFTSSTHDRCKFVEIREWCWDTWGAGIELFLYSTYPWDKPLSHAWCWISEGSSRPMRLRILFKDEQQYIYAKLKWS